MRKQGLFGDGDSFRAGFYWTANARLVQLTSFGGRCGIRPHGSFALRTRPVNVDPSRRGCVGRQVAVEFDPNCYWYELLFGDVTHRVRAAHFTRDL